MSLLNLVVDAVAVYRLTKLVIDDEILADIREKVWEKYPPETTKIGYLTTCPWCVSIWMAGLVFALRKVSPELATYISSTLAASAATGIAYARGL
jgi:hypothetical protein